jgi:hypothetical protein
MRKPVPLQLHAVRSSRNGRPTRRQGTARAAVHLVNGRPSMRTFPGLRLFQRIRRAVGEITAMAVMLALSIVLAHAILIVMFPV